MAKDFALLVLGAMFYTLACPPYDWSAAAWVALTPFYLVLRHKTWRSATLIGITFGVFSCAGIGYWIYVTTAQYFSLSLPFAVVLTLLNYTYFAGIYFALAAVITSVLLRGASSWVRTLSIPTTWVASELARTYGIAGIPWELLGYTQYRFLPLIQIADLTGVYGLSFLLALSSYAAAEVLIFLKPQWQGKKPQTVVSTQDSVVSSAKQPGHWTLDTGHSSLIPDFRLPTPCRFPWPAVTVFTVALLFTLFYGILRLQQYSVLPSETSPEVNIAVVQTDVPSAYRWHQTQQASNLMHYISLSGQGIANQHPDLVIWPEFAVGFYLNQEPLLQAQLERFTTSIDTALLMGAPRRNIASTETQVFNSAYFFSSEGEGLSTYDKRRLIPFAEYLPPMFALLRDRRTEGPNDFTPGTEATIFSLPQALFGVVICYEVTYPHVVQSLVRGGAQFLVNLSNDMWGANQGAAAQHYSMSVFRAVEYRRYLVRAATAGVSGFLAPSGRLYGVVPGREGVSVEKVFPRQEMTVYAQYGDWFAVVCVVVALTALIFRRSQATGKFWSL